MLLGIEIRALCMLGKCSHSELYPALQMLFLKNVYTCLKKKNFYIPHNGISYSFTLQNM